MSQEKDFPYSPILGMGLRPSILLWRGVWILRESPFKGPSLMEFLHCLCHFLGCCFFLILRVFYNFYMLNIEMEVWKMILLYSCSSFFANFSLKNELDGHMSWSKLRATGLFNLLNGEFFITYVVINWLVVSTHLKSICQIGNSSPNRAENKKYLKPPPSITILCIPSSVGKTNIYCWVDA